MARSWDESNKNMKTVARTASPHRPQLQRLTLSLPALGSGANKCIALAAIELLLVPFDIVVLVFESTTSTIPSNTPAVGRRLSVAVMHITQGSYLAMHYVDGDVI